MKSLSQLAAEILRDCAVQCHTDPVADINTTVRRIEEEGTSYLTLTLPVLAEAVENGLRTGQLDLTAVTHWVRRGGLPLYLRGFLRQIFDENGQLLDRPSIDAIGCIRQFCLMWKKIQLPCDESRTSKAFSAYVQADEEIPGLEQFQEAQPSLFRAFKFVAGVLWSEILGDADNTASTRTSLPRHGPGATAERIRGNAKYHLRTWHERLDAWFPLDQFAVPNANWLGVESAYDPIFLSPGAEPPVRVITVPKTMKGPRIIAIEPVCMQYAQQALMAVIVQSLETHHLTRRRIGFSDQSVNQSLALLGSKTGHLATLDLKEASDRVPLWGVVEMLECVPNLRDALLACRSTHADVPNHGVIHLRKFASMGSATCFPIEAVFFFTVMISGMLLSHGAQFRAKRVKQLARLVHVYGDDIICPVDQVDAVISSLEAFGLKVNRQKSFWTGKFRESCGVDAYDGERVTPVYVRRPWPTSAADASGVLSWVSLGNQLYFAGYWGAAAHVRRQVEQLLGPLPMVDPEAGCLGWNNVRRTQSVQGWDKNLHKFQVRTFTTRSVWRDDHIGDLPALMKCLLRLEWNSVSAQAGIESCDARHLDRSVRSVSLSMKRRWVSPV